MSKNNKFEGQRSAGIRPRERDKGNSVTRISVRGVRRNEPDYRRYAQVVIELAQAKAEAEAQAQHEAIAVRARSTDAATTKVDNAAERKGVA